MQFNWLVVVEYTALKIFMSWDGVGMCYINV